MEEAGDQIFLTLEELGIGFVPYCPVGRGFVFIHPFVDGNGRIHRYLIHHALHRKGYVEKGLIFPVSSVMLERLDEYRQVLEAFSIPRLNYIDWKPGKDNNVVVLNETADLYRYFDATRQAEFLYDCVVYRVETNSSPSTSSVTGSMLLS